DDLAHRDRGVRRKLQGGGEPGLHTPGGFSLRLWPGLAAEQPEAHAGSGRQGQDAGPAVLAAEGEPAAGLVPGERRDLAALDLAADEKLGRVGEADEQNA